MWLPINSKQVDIYGPENPSRCASKGRVDMLGPLRTCIHRNFTLIPSDEYTKVYFPQG